MNKKLNFLLFLLFLCGAWCIAQEIREPVWAGKFYDQRTEILSRQIDIFLEKAKKSTTLPEKILALIVPHAGYIYSGQVAAFGYKQVQGRDYEVVIIIAPSHRYGFQGCSIYPRGGYRTPLGVAYIDEELASKISFLSGFKYIPQAHKEEHSIEVQIPFIQKVLPEAKIVPILMGAPSRNTVNSLAKALTQALKDKKALLVASTDLSHYLPKKEANEIDNQTANLIKALDTESLQRKIERGEGIMCGGGGVVASLLYAKSRGEARVELLHYADSSQAGGPESGVVGYLSAAIYLEQKDEEKELSQEEKKELLQIARKAIEKIVIEKTIFEYTPQNSNLFEKKGAFVTLKKHHSLRGCIGFVEPIMPLYETVIRAAIFAACKDPRFPPLSQEELKNLEIEISVLSTLKKIEDPSQIEVGKHGLLIVEGEKKGILLPQVPVENNWSRDMFLRQACLKAGLPPDAWKKGAEIFVFEAQVFD